jgi:hypothetical protein
VTAERDVIVSVQDGNYRMVEVARVTPPDDAGPITSVSVTFGRGATPYRPTSIHVTYGAASDGSR